MEQPVGDRQRQQQRDGEVVALTLGATQYAPERNGRDGQEGQIQHRGKQRRRCVEADAAEQPQRCKRGE